MGIQISDENQRVMDFVKQKVEARDGSSMAEAPQEAMKLLKQFQFERQRWNERYECRQSGLLVSIHYLMSIRNMFFVIINANDGFFNLILVTLLYSNMGIYVIPIICISFHANK